MRLKVGDIVERTVGPTTKMDVRVRYIEHGMYYCESVDTPGWPKDELWRFETNTGVEYDPDLKWGSPWGRSGSKISLEPKGGSSEQSGKEIDKST